MTAYIGIIHKDADSDYGISFPDFPGCISAGSTLDDVRAMGKEALQFHIEGLLEDKEPLPAPSSLENVMQHADYQDGVAVLIDVDLPAKTTRINITLDESLVRKIDAVTANRSAFFASAAREQLRQHL